MSAVRAMRVGKVGEVWKRRIDNISTDDLGDGDVLVEIEYSCINYKDGLAGSEKGRIARIDPLIPGVDLAGKVLESSDPSVAVGSTVIVHGNDIGVAHNGGFSTHARIPAKWTVPMPTSLSSKTAMMVGTAGFTAAMSVDALEHAGLKPGSGPVLVTGATGGVGSYSVGMLAARGYEVVASTGKVSEGEWLKSIGASSVIDRSITSAPQTKPIEKEQWAGAIDCVGGATLAFVLRTLRYGAAVAASGLTGGSDLQTTVLPFILRGVNLLGIDSVMGSMDDRKIMWHRIATDLRPLWLDSQDSLVVGLDDLGAQLDLILKGEIKSRVLVNPRLA